MALALACVGALALAPPPQSRVWGADVNPGAGPKLASSVHSELLALIKAPAADRARRARELAQRRATSAIEAWKRFRNPELLDLARACIAHEDWHVVHRGLHWARCLEDPTLLDLAWPLLEHAEPRVREKAAICCLEVWTDAATATFAGGAAKQQVATRLAAEEDPLVKQALLALQRRLDTKLEVRHVSKEVVLKLPDGLQWTPFLSGGMAHLAEAAPGVELVQQGDPSPLSATTLPVDTCWSAPLLGYGREEVTGIVLQPFGKPKHHGELTHTGQDLGGCLDGAGLHALADGIVRWVHTGSDCGTLIVVEHRRSADQVVNAVYMHGGAFVFVSAGEHVEAGQLLGTVGLSFSIENGGHFAHLHLGLYPGPFDVSHNYGYKPAGEGLGDWLDPAECLPRWIASVPPDPAK